MKTTNKEQLILKAIILNKIEELGWTINDSEDEDYKYSYELSQYSPCGQDFNISVGMNDIMDFATEIYGVHENFDVSLETYLWLDSEGHGRNGAPYDMMDVYSDMEACKEMISELYDGINELINK